MKLFSSQVRPKISVITVSYNSEDTIARALKSVFDQDYENIEHILIDGASTDRTLEVVEDNHNCLTKIVSERDCGIYDAMNKGLELVSGDIICFLNSDDYYANPRVLSTVAKRMTMYGLDALLGDVAFFKKNNPTKVVRRYRSHQFTPASMAWGWMPAHPGLFLSKGVVRRVGKFKIDYRIAGDFEFIARAFCCGELRYHRVSEVMVYMQAGGVSNANLASKVRLNVEVLRACRENGINTNILKILTKYPFKLLEIFRHS